MKMVDLEKSKELYIYYEDMKYPSVYGIIQVKPLMLINEDGNTIYYPESIEDILAYDLSLMCAEDKRERWFITEEKLK